MMRGFHFLMHDRCCDEDLFAGNPQPWQIGETRIYTPVTLDAGDGQVLSEIGYRFYSTLWDALLQADGPIACVVEVGEIIGVPVDDKAGRYQVSPTRKLIQTRDVGTELRLFACDCAEHVLHIHEQLFPDENRFRQAIAVARRFAERAISADELDVAWISAREAVERMSESSNPCVVQAACSALAVTFGDPEGAANLAVHCGRLAADGVSGSDSEAAWQRSLFEQKFARVFRDE
jgi:hypothetical protein